jgi:hypothetical protein
MESPSLSPEGDAMSYSEYYRERAAEAERNARAATLPLVREQYLKAAFSWAQLADHAERMTGHRERFGGGRPPDNDLTGPRLDFAQPD